MLPKLSGRFGYDTTTARDSSCNPSSAWRRMIPFYGVHPRNGPARRRVVSLWRRAWRRRCKPQRSPPRPRRRVGRPRPDAPDLPRLSRRGRLPGRPERDRHGHGRAASAERRKPDHLPARDLRDRRHLRRRRSRSSGAVRRSARRSSSRSRSRASSTPAHARRRGVRRRQPVRRPVDIADRGRFVGFVMSLGAGFYEELTFRVVLFGLGAKLLVWLVRQAARRASPARARRAASRSVTLASWSRGASCAP